MAPGPGNRGGLLNPDALRAFESLPAGVVVFDRAGRVLFASRLAHRCLDIVGNEEAVLPLLLPGIFSRSDPAAFLGSGIDPIIVEPESGPASTLEFDISVFDPAQQLYTAVVRDISRRREQELLRDILYHIAESGHRTTNLDTFMFDIDRALSRVIDTSNFFIALVDSERGTLTFPYMRDAASEVRPQEIPQERLKKTLTAHVLRTGKPLLIDSTGIMEMHDRGVIEIVGTVPQVWMGAPLRADEDVIGIICVQNYDDAGAFESEDLNLLTFVSNQIGNALWRRSAEIALRNHAREVEAARDRISVLLGELQGQHEELSRTHRRLRDDLAVAARLQRSRLPGKPPEIPGIEFAWFFHACEEVAGDMFNVIRFDEDRIGLYVLDVSGHGVPAAFLSMTLSRLLSNYDDGAGILRVGNGRDGQPDIAPPSLVAERLNRRFPMALDVSQFFTMLYGIVDVRRRTFRFVRAGHHCPCLVRDDKVELCEEMSGPAVGINPSPHFEELCLHLLPGDAFVLTTDGVHEARNAAGEMMGEQRMLDALAAADSTRAADLVTALRGAVEQWCGGAPAQDDITIMAFSLE